LDDAEAGCGRIHHTGNEKGGEMDRMRACVKLLLVFEERKTNDEDLFSWLCPSL